MIGDKVYKLIKQKRFKESACISWNFCYSKDMVSLAIKMKRFIF